MLDFQSVLKTVRLADNFINPDIELKTWFDVTPDESGPINCRVDKKWKQICGCSDVVM